MRTLLYIRWQQLRELFSRSSLHTNRSYLIAVFLLILLVALLAKKNVHLYLVVPAIISLLIHFTRKDQMLIKKSGLNTQIVMFTEYLLISVPFIITCLFRQLFGSIIILLVFLSVLIFLKNEVRYPEHQ